MSHFKVRYEVDTANEAGKAIAANEVHKADKNVKADEVDETNEAAKASSRLGIPIFGSHFWDPHWKRNSDSVFDCGDSGWIFFLEFRCLESQRIRIPICEIWNSGNLFAQELTTSHHC